MGERRIVVRILGVASTTRGFASTVTEGPRRLVHCGLQRIPPTTKSAINAIGAVLRRYRPLFVAFEQSTALSKRKRGQLFGQAVAKACDIHGVMLLPIESAQTKALSEEPKPTKWDVADAIVLLFPEMAPKLPARRKPWQSEDDRIGLFMALAAAVAAWEGFRKPPR